MDLDTARAEIILGQECEAFFNTDPGRYVKARHQETIQKAIDELKEADPYNEKEIAKIQAEIKGADNALTWLNEAIYTGRNSYQQMEILSQEEEN